MSDKNKFAILIEDEPIHQIKKKKLLNGIGAFDSIKVFSNGKAAFDEMLNV